MYYKVQFGAFGGLHPDAVADMYPPDDSQDSPHGAPVNDATTTTTTGAAAGGSGVSLANGGMGADGGALADTLGGGNDAAVVDGFFSSVATAAGVGVAPQANNVPGDGGLRAGVEFDGGGGGGSGLPGLISPGAFLANGGGAPYDGGGGGHESAVNPPQNPPVAAGEGEADGDRAGEEGEHGGAAMSVPARAVPFTTATAPFDHVSFFRDMKLVSRAVLLFRSPPWEVLFDGCMCRRRVVFLPWWRWRHEDAEVVQWNWMWVRFLAWSTNDYCALNCAEKSAIAAVGKGALKQQCWLMHAQEHTICWDPAFEA